MASNTDNTGFLGTAQNEGSSVAFDAKGNGGRSVTSTSSGCVASRVPRVGREVLPQSGVTTGGQAMCECLRALGVEVMFGYPGGAIMPFYDDLFTVGQDLRHILVRHEQGAVHAAEGYSLVTGKVGVAVATSGPGATNLVTGIANAMLDSVPVVCLAGQVFSSLLGSDAFQETDLISITIPITKWNFQITRAEEIPYIMCKAFFLAQAGRPGPIVLDITKDAQIGSFNWEDIGFDLPTYDYGYHPVLPEKITRAADLINKASKPMILLGHGVLIAQAESEIQNLAEKSGIPVSSTLLGLSAMPTDHPLYVGMLGMHGHYGPNMLTNKADLLIAIGMRFDDRVTSDLAKYAPDAKVIHIDVDPAEISKNKWAEVAVIGDAKEALQALLPLVEDRKHDEWLQQFHDYAQQEHDEIIEKAIHPKTEHILMSEAVNLLSELSARTAIIVADVGQNQMMAARYYKFKYSRSYLTSGGLGTMGYSLPASIGAIVADLGRPVVTIVGDGAFQMTIQELGTIMQENLPAKILLLNNGSLGMVRQWQELFFEKRYSFTNMVNPDYMKICEGYNVSSARIVNRDELHDGIKTMLEAEGPFLLEVIVEKEENVFPMITAGAAVDEIRLK